MLFFKSCFNISRLLGFINRDVERIWVATDGAIFGVSLARAAFGVDGGFVPLAAHGAHVA